MSIQIKLTVFTYMPLPEMRSDSLLHQDSSLRHKRSSLHLVYFCAHAQFAKRIRIRWAEASCVTWGHPCLFPPAHHPCTIQWWESAGPLPYSSEWWALPWRQWRQKGVLQSWGESLLDEDEILQNMMQEDKLSTFLFFTVCFIYIHTQRVKRFQIFNGITRHMALFTFYTFGFLYISKPSQLFCTMRPYNSKLILILAVKLSMVHKKDKQK